MCAISMLVVKNAKRAALELAPVESLSAWDGKFQRGYSQRDYDDLLCVDIKRGV